MARELAFHSGVLEPLQTADSLEGQVEELNQILDTHADPPISLLGYSWGAWLGCIVAARYPDKMRKLILVSSGPFEAEYARDIMETRLDRLDEEERREVHTLTKSLHASDGVITNSKMARFGQLMSKTDSFDAVHHRDEPLAVQHHVFQNVWKDAEKYRSSGKLLQRAAQIQCPVMAIHGDYDPHPAEGVKKPLSRMLKDFRFILLRNCGHTPWIERQARDEFFRVLRKELKT